MKLNVHSMDELVALAAANAPNPTREVIDMYRKYDERCNPDNVEDSERGLRKWRTEIQIQADFKLDFAKTLFERMSKRSA